jgi:2-oxo-3-hexenedioate decarboxylase/2-keto-4-pentenoate hydratase
MTKPATPNPAPSNVIDRLVKPDPDGACARLLVDHAVKARFVGLSDRHRLASLDDAYDVQDRFVAAQLKSLATTPVGYKIGLTSQRMQEMCGIPHPLAGVVYASRVHASGAQVPRVAFGRLGLEFELCVRLKAPLSGPVSRDEVAAAVEAVAPAVELIEDRNADYAALDMKTLIADNSWNAGIVTGDFVTPPADLAGLHGVVGLPDGIDEGDGRDVLGHPYEPVAWLAAHLAARGRRIEAGEVIMTGSWVKTRFPAAPFRYSFEIEGVGGVAVDVI